SAIASLAPLNAVANNYFTQVGLIDVCEFNYAFEVGLLNLTGRNIGVSVGAFNPTFHVRGRNPSGCWGFGHRSSLHSRFCRLGDVA
ncbi:MAG: hypothetical protein II863_19805, partial [Kiritimatiellae bacterium]|nr:hypothetical protein [Kiritimatiellia bacterium]